MNKLLKILNNNFFFSPSLFQRPNTPQLSSTQFEWTIDEVSSLYPTNVEPHETQFHDSPDPEIEAKAQSAISSYFKEQQIVPSPIDCPLRSHRIILSEINGDTPLSKPGRRIRDCSSQTELTLPPILPPALEEALKPYFQPHLTGASSELKKSGYSHSFNSTCSEVKDTSLRRKLFDMHNVIVLENENHHQQQLQLLKTSNHSAHSNSSPISLNSLQHTAIVGKLSESLDKSSFGSLSPISASDGLSPHNRSDSATKRKSRFSNLFNDLEEVELLSPIQAPVKRKPLADHNRSQYRSDINNLNKNDITSNTSAEGEEENEKFTPERSSSPLNILQHNNMAEFSTDSFNAKVSRLKVNSSKSSSTKENILKTSRCQQQQDTDIFMSQDETEDLLENTVDIDDMQVSQLSTHSSNCSSSQSDTPRGKRRSASRKNLSQSFSANWLQDDEETDVESTQSLKIKEILSKKQFTTTTNTVTTSSVSSSSSCAINHNPSLTNSPKKSLTFYRTDSGFNEMSHNSSSCEGSLAAAKSQELPHQSQLSLTSSTQQDLLVCCSTPSTKDNFNFMI